MKELKDIHSYDDIISLPHHVSNTHAHMSRLDRAAQFASFAALTCHKAAIKETARLTDSKIELDDVIKADLDMKLRALLKMTFDKADVAVTYFKHDIRKSGGEYVTAEGVIKKIDEYERELCLTDGTKIPIDDIYDIKCELFKAFE